MIALNVEINSYRLEYYIRKDKIPKELLDSMRICIMNQEEIYFYNVKSNSATNCSGK